MTLGHLANAIYRDVVSAALDLEIDMLARAGERLVDRELARTFGGDDLVLHELRRLRVLNAAAEHYDLGAYHNALVHAVVPDQIEALNEAHAIGGEPLRLCGGRYVVRGIDVEAFADAFFADTDFAVPAPEIARPFEPDPTGVTRDLPRPGMVQGKEESDDRRSRRPSRSPQSFHRAAAVPAVDAAVVR